MSIFNYVDEDTIKGSIKSSVFGLNTGYITKVEFNPNSGKGGSKANSVEVEISIDSDSIRTRVYEVTGDVYNKNNQTISPGEAEYKSLAEKETVQRLGIITHVVKSLGVTDEALKKALSAEVKDFKQWCDIVLKLLPNDYQKRKIDVFLEYQWKIRGDYDRTFLQIPPRLKYDFLCPHVKPDGIWEKQVSEKGLRYVDKVGNVHPFKRDSYYMDSKKANQQFLNKSPESSAISSNNGSTSDSGEW